MNKYLLTLVAIIALTACGKQEEPPVPETPYVALTNDQIISETKKCRDAGLQATAYVVSSTNQSIVSVQCSP